MKRMGLQERKRRGRALFWGVVVCLMMIVAAGVAAHAFADDGGGIDVSCYSQQGMGDSVGEVTVYEAVRATATCNSVYYDCQGECVGCFIDPDYPDTTCVDEYGRLFLK